MLAVVLALNSASGALRPIQVLSGAGLLGLQTAVAALGLWGPGRDATARG